MPDALRNRLGLVVAAVVVVLLLSANRVSAFLTDLWWFQALGFEQVFTDILLTQIGVGAVFGIALGLIVALNLWVAKRLRPVVLPANRREAVIERYRQMAEPYVPWIIVGAAALFALSAGSAVAAQWPRYLLWVHGGEFGHADPMFGRDIGFYVFDLPWFKFLQGWLFTSLLMTLLLTAAAHYLLGSIRVEVPGDRVTPQAKVHLSVLLAAVLGAHAWGYWLDRFMLNFSPRGQVTGASYTDVHAELPALNLLLIVAGLAIVLVLLNIRRRGWLLPGAAIGLLVLAGIILQGIYPAAIQRLRVDPQELEREEPYIAFNLDETRRAYGLELDDIATQRFEVRNDFSREDVEPNQQTLNNVRVWDPQVLQTTYQQLQAIRTYYEFHDVDVDRYEIDGTLRQIMIAARELAPRELRQEAQTWQNLHLTYTHGYGDVSSRVNVATAEGQPVFIAGGIPPTGDDVLVPDEPGIYYGESHRDYSVVRTKQLEIDFESSETGQAQTTTYAGKGGVPLGNYLRRGAFALRFADPNLVLSGLLDGDSRIIFNRTVQDRVRRIAPFLELDADPYLAVADGRLVWIQDAYTASAFYPYSERREFPLGSGRAINYIRNSVKATVDAYDGTVTLYVVDPSDPVVRAWQQAFPDPFADVSEASDDLIRHFRYPEDLFTLQSSVYTTYHIEGTGEFYSKADAWEIPQDPAHAANNPDDRPRRLDPYYLLMRLPGEAEVEFVLIQPYKALNKPNMIAWLAGRSDPEHYGELFTVEFPSDQAILGPAQAQARIEQESEIASYITLRDQRGSKVIRGNLIILPIERSILYVEPLFLENPQAQIPELDQVVLVMGNDVVMAETLEAALAELLEADEVPVEGGPDDDGEPDEPDEPEVTVDDLIADALQAFLDAQEALQQGDLAAYQRNVERAEGLLARLAEERGVPAPGEQPSPGASPAPAATASPGG